MKEVTKAVSFESDLRILSRGEQTSLIRPILNT